MSHLIELTPEEWPLPTRSLSEPYTQRGENNIVCQMSHLEVPLHTRCNSTSKRANNTEKLDRILVYGDTVSLHCLQIPSWNDDDDGDGDDGG